MELARLPRSDELPTLQVSYTNSHLIHHSPVDTRPGSQGILGLQKRLPATWRKPGRWSQIPRTWTFIRPPRFSYPRLLMAGPTWVHQSERRWSWSRGFIANKPFDLVQLPCGPPMPLVVRNSSDVTATGRVTSWMSEKTGAKVLIIRREMRHRKRLLDREGMLEFLSCFASPLSRLLRCCCFFGPSLCRETEPSLLGSPLRDHWPPRRPPTDAGPSDRLAGFTGPCLERPVWCIWRLHYSEREGGGVEARPSEKDEAACQRSCGSRRWVWSRVAPLSMFAAGVWVVWRLCCRWWWFSGDEDDQPGAVACVCGAACDAAAGGEPRRVLSPGTQRAGKNRRQDKGLLLIWAWSPLLVWLLCISATLSCLVAIVLPRPILRIGKDSLLMVGSTEAC